MTPPKKRDRRAERARPQVAVNAPKAAPEPSAGKGHSRKTPIISIDTYNRMYEAWCARQTAAHVMETCHVNRTTADRYIERGDPSRKLPAIRARWERTMQAAQMAEDYSLVKERREVQTVARAFLQRIAKRIGELEPKELDANKLIAQLQTTQVVLERTLGVADATVAVQQDDRFRGWSNEDLLEFAKSGTAPEHARGADAAANAASNKRRDAE